MRRFTHHALNTSIARPLDDWLTKAGPVSSLIQTARQLSVLESEVLALLPPAIRPAVAVAGIRRDGSGPGQEHTLVLLAAHGAAAARIRQVVPSLLARLQQRGSPVSAIRVRVQPDVGRDLDWDPSRQRKPRHGMSPNGLASMAELARALPDSPLREAVASLLDHHRQAPQDGNKR